MKSGSRHPDPHSSNGDSVSIDRSLATDADQEQLSPVATDPSSEVDHDLLPPGVEELWPEFPLLLTDDPQFQPLAGAPSEVAAVEPDAPMPAIEVAAVQRALVEEPPLHQAEPEVHQAEPEHPQYEELPLHPSSATSDEGPAAAGLEPARARLVRPKVFPLAPPIRPLTFFSNEALPTDEIAEAHAAPLDETASTSVAESVPSSPESADATVEPSIGAVEPLIDAAHHGAATAAADAELHVPPPSVHTAIEQSTARTTERQPMPSRAYDLRSCMRRSSR
jgi:hypothetical protein